MCKYKNKRPEFDLLCRVYSFIDAQNAGPAHSKLESISVSDWIYLAKGKLPQYVLTLC